MKLFGRSSTTAPTPRRRLRDEVVRERAGEDLTGYRFQRGRTLTGSPSAQLQASADHASHVLTTPRQHAHQLRRRRRNLGWLLAGSIVACGIIWWSMNEYIADPVVHVVSLPLAKDTRAYRDTINQYLDANPFERMIPLVNQSRLLAYVQVSHPEVKSISIAPGTFARPDMRITMRRPVASWALRGSNTYVDETGAAFAINHFDTPPIQVVDQTGIRSDSVTIVASNRFLGFIGKLVGYASLMDRPLERITIPAGTTHQVQGYVKGVAYPIKFSIDREAGEQVEDMVRSLGYMEAHSLAPSYVDVRVDRRVFYR